MLGLGILLLPRGLPRPRGWTQQTQGPFGGSTAPACYFLAKVLSWSPLHAAHPTNSTLGPPSRPSTQASPPWALPACLWAHSCVMWAWLLTLSGPQGSALPSALLKHQHTPNTSSLLPA